MICDPHCKCGSLLDDYWGVFEKWMPKEAISSSSSAISLGTRVIKYYFKQDWQEFHSPAVETLWEPLPSQLALELGHLFLFGGLVLSVFP